MKIPMILICIILLGIKYPILFIYLTCHTVGLMTLILLIKLPVVIPSYRAFNTVNHDFTTYGKSSLILKQVYDDLS